MGLLSSLFRPSRLIAPIRERKVEIKGFFVLLLTAVLTLVTMMPVLAILVVKLLAFGGWPLDAAIMRALTLTAVLLVMVPLSKWWFQSLLIHMCLRSKREDLPQPRFSVVLLGRSFGLVPMVFLIPLKVLLLSPFFVIPHIFYPPLSSLLLTSLDGVIGWPTGMPWDLFVLSRKLPGVRPSFVISLFFVGLTYILTVRKIHQLTELPKRMLYARVLLAIVLWDLLSVVFLLLVPLVL